MDVTKGETMQQYKNVAINGNMTQDELKIEAVKYFGQEIKLLNKATIAKKLKELKKECDNEKKNIQRVIHKMKNGKGNGFSEPPEDFSPEIVDGKKRREAFAASCRQDIEYHEMYHEWKTCYFSLKNDLAKTELEKENRHIKNLLAEKNSGKI